MDAKAANTCEQADSQVFPSIGAQRGGGNLNHTPATH